MPIWEWLSLTGCGTALGTGLFACLHVLYSLDPATYSKVTLPADEWQWGWLAVFVAAGIGLLFWAVRRVRGMDGALSPREAALVPLPLLAGGAAAVWSPGFPGVLALTLTLGWTVFRLLLLLPDADGVLCGGRHAARLKLFGAFGGLLAVYLLVAGYWMQCRALAVMHLYFLDWGLFLDVAQNTLRGEWFVTSETGLNFLGNHFMPLTIFLLLPLAALADSPEPFFWFNVLLLYCNAPLIYLLARVRELPRSYALALAVIVLFCPSLTNLILAQRYGFHENYFFMPMLILAAICWSKQWYGRLFLIFLLSLLIKETIPVVWFGIGAVMMLRGHRWRGALIAAVSVGYFFFMVKFLMPYLQGTSDYRMLFVFSNLGHSLGEVMLSPFTRPAVFWGTLFSENNLIFAMLILLPVFFLTLVRPLLLLPAVLPFLFVAVQEAEWLRGICTQHHADFLIIVYINAVFVLSRVREEMEPGRWLRLLGWGLPLRRGRLAPALLGASLVTAGGAFYFFAQGYHGKFSFNSIAMQRSFAPEFEELRKLIPPGASLNASFAPAAHFALRNRVYPSSLVLHRLTDYVLLDLFAEYENAERFDQLRGYLRQHDYSVIYRCQEAGRLLMLLKRGADFALPDRLVRLSEEEFARVGDRLAQKWPDCEVRVRPEGRRVLFFIRPVRRLSCDFRIDVLLIGTRGEVTGRQNLFGDGVTPAFLAPEGATMCFAMELPPEWAALREIRVKLAPRPPVDYEHLLLPISPEMTVRCGRMFRLDGTAEGRWDEQTKPMKIEGKNEKND